MSETHRIKAESSGTRLDRMLADAIPSLSRTRIQALMAAGNVVPPARTTVAGRTYTVTVPDPCPAVPAGEAMPLDIAYEDRHLIVVDKPAGLVVHPAPGHPSGTLVNALIAHCGAGLEGIGGEQRPGIVHRLDKDTSGLLVAAKTEPAYRWLRALFDNHDIERHYTALVCGLPAHVGGRVDAPIGRDRRHRKRMAVVGSGRRAVTHYRVEEAYGRRAARISCRLETGRTHQVRVHLAHLGHPPIGDPLYGGRRKGLPAHPRQALHAARLAFRHPADGAPLDFSSALPEDLASLEATLRSLNS